MHTGQTTVEREPNFTRPGNPRASLAFLVTFTALHSSGTQPALSLRRAWTRVNTVDPGRESERETDLYHYTPGAGVGGDREVHVESRPQSTPLDV